MKNLKSNFPIHPTTEVRGLSCVFFVNANSVPKYYSFIEIFTDFNNQ